jgi:hypothetical protein
MKTNKFFFIALVFITGMVAGISTIGLMAFTSAPAAPAPGGAIVPISSAVANTYFKNYMSGATPFNQVIKGFMVDKAQLDAMNNLFKENPTLSGFRIYFGKDSDAKKVGIVIGVDASGKDMLKNTIFSTDSPISSPCPPICDSSSPIIMEK